jgi:hypothetical protein
VQCCIVRDALEKNALNAVGVCALCETRWGTLAPSRRKASHTRSVVSIGSALAKIATNLR